MYKWKLIVKYITALQFLETHEPKFLVLFSQVRNLVSSQQKIQGNTGYKETQGCQELLGNQGEHSTNGFQGNIRGGHGLQGNQGIQGHPGNQGIQGHPGNLGIQGHQGIQGNQGNQGNHVREAGQHGSLARGDRSQGKHPREGGTQGNHLRNEENLNLPTDEGTLDKSSRKSRDRRTRH